MTELFRRRDARAGATPPGESGPGSTGSAPGSVQSVLPWAGESGSDPIGTAPIETPPDDLDDDLDLNSGWDRPRVSRLTVLLTVGVLAVAAFAGGVLVQKRHDAGLASAGSGAAGARARAAGLGAAGFGGAPGFGGAAGFGGAGGAGTGTGTGAGTGTGTTSAATPVVVGTVVSIKGTDLTVKNFAGASVVVHVAAGTPVTAPGLVPLAAGMTVAVTGTKAADGSVTATGVVARRPG